MALACLRKTCGHTLALYRDPLKSNAWLKPHISCRAGSYSCCACARRSVGRLRTGAGSARCCQGARAARWLFYALGDPRRISSVSASRVRLRGLWVWVSGLWLRRCEMLKPKKTSRAWSGVSPVRSAHAAETDAQQHCLRTGSVESTHKVPTSRTTTRNTATQRSCHSVD